MTNFNIETAIVRESEALQDAITKVFAAERITKAELAKLSRELLIKWHNDHNPELINMLLGQVEGKFGLTPMNWRVAAMYFQHFIGAASNWTEIEKAVKQGGKREPLVFKDKASKNAQKRTADKRVEWLSNEDNNIWNWVDDNVNLEKKVNYVGNISKAIDAAIKAEISMAEIMDAVNTAIAAHE